ncbi:MAG: 50S ribosomal protein L2 [Verrucomicrobia bacterium]|nr:50S ribosomal protein L2 [Verrucomicrobiota bacterium]
MALKEFRPLTPSLRFTQLHDFSELTPDSAPERSLMEIKRRTGGRNAHGRMTSRHRGGGHKKHYRIIEWNRRKRTQAGKVVGIQYDPNRSARIALVEYAANDRAYILAPDGLKVGATVASGASVPAEVGNSLPLRVIPQGLPLHNLEIVPGRGAQMVRSAGAAAICTAIDKDYALIRLPSGELRRLHADCYATVGQVGNISHEKVSLGKAGRGRWLGRRPHTRGMVMNPVDHPMGGGQGKSKGGGGRQHPVSPWGQLAKGLKTRHRHKPSNRFIVEDRRKKRSS